MRERRRFRARWGHKLGPGNRRGASGTKVGRRTGRGGPAQRHGNGGGTGLGVVGGEGDGRLHAHCRARGAGHQAYKKGGEVLYDGVLNEDTYEAMEDKGGRGL